ncbi:hypothetical protein [Methylomonas fluvii]|nr:hypothetical protein [Methylomonas fluvii]
MSLKRRLLSNQRLIIYPPGGLRFREINHGSLKYGYRKIYRGDIVNLA